MWSDGHVAWSFRARHKHCRCKTGLGKWEYPFEHGFLINRSDPHRNKGLCLLFFEVLTRFWIVKLRVGAAAENCCCLAFPSDRMNVQMNYQFIKTVRFSCKWTVCCNMLLSESENV